MSLNFKRKLGLNESFVNACHANGNLNVMCGLTLLTRSPIDEGLMKCALQEFQHSYPQLTSRIRDENNQLYFIPMECPTFPLDIEFNCQDMLHQKFDTENGPLWRVQLITQSTMDKAALDFGPELSAILSDDSSLETRWRYFLRYFQGNVNGREIEKFDDKEEGYRSFILFTFHPSITDTLGCFHLMRQFLFIMDSILDGDDGSKNLLQSRAPAEIHQPIEELLSQRDAGIQLGDMKPFFKLMGSIVKPRKSLFEAYNLSQFHKYNPEVGAKSQVVRGRLDEEQTTELLAMMDEDDVNLLGVILAAGLIAVSRILQSEVQDEYPPNNTLNLRATIEANLRPYCESAPKHGSLTTFQECDYEVPPITDRADFWRFAHEQTVKQNSNKGSKEPLKALRIYNKMFNLSGNSVSRELAKPFRIQNELGVAVYGDLGSLFRREQTTTSGTVECWNRPLSGTQRNIRLEDTFHMTASHHMGCPLTHTAHILYGRLNYSLVYQTTYIDQNIALKVRDETIEILRMATEKSNQ